MISSNKLQKIKEKSLNLVLASTSHGLPNIFRTERIFIKILWFILFLFFSAIGLLMVAQSISNFFNYETLTLIELIYENPIRFPDTTFINMNNPRSNASINESFVFCFFDGRPCDFKFFEIIQDNLGFVSYKFKERNMSKSGYMFGLVLLINLGNISNSISGTGGLKVIFSNKTDIGYYGGLPTKGYNIPTGFHSDLIVNKIFTSKLDLPYNRCIKDTNSSKSFDSDLFRYLVENSKFSYSQDSCINYCIGREINIYFNISKKPDDFLNIFYSNTNVSQTEIFSYFLANINDINESCLKECPLECETVNYEPIISSSQFSLDKLIQFLKSYSFPNDLYKNLTQNDFNNLVYMHIYFDSQGYKYVSESPKMEFIDLISNIGGNLGLFIGISFLSFFEIIELLLETLLILFEKTKIHNNLIN